MAINGDSKLTSYLAASHLHPVWFFLVTSMSSSTGICDKLTGRETKWLTVRDAGLFLKTSEQLGKRPLPSVGSPAHSAKEHIQFTLGFPEDCATQLFFFLFFLKGPPDWDVCCWPSSIGQKKKTPFLAFPCWVEAVSKRRFGPKGDQKTLPLHTSLQVLEQPDMEQQSRSQSSDATLANRGGRDTGEQAAAHVDYT